MCSRPDVSEVQPCCAARAKSQNRKRYNRLWKEIVDIRLPFAHNGAMAITRRQRQVYDFISEFVQKNGYSPSFEEIGAGTGTQLAGHGAQAHHQPGEKRPAHARLQPQPLDRSAAAQRPPEAGHGGEHHHGAAAAGTHRRRPADRSGAEATRPFRWPISCARKKCSCSKCAATPCRTSTSSTATTCWSRRAKTAHNGDIVVALVDGTDATLKRFYREGDKIRLQPSNATMKPIIVPAAAVQIQGRVIGVLRKY